MEDVFPFPRGDWLRLFSRQISGASIEVGVIQLMVWGVWCFGSPGPPKMKGIGILTWRTIPVSKWLITMVSKSPKWGYSPYKWPKWLVNRG